MSCKDDRRSRRAVTILPLPSMSVRECIADMAEHQKYHLESPVLGMPVAQPPHGHREKISNGIEFCMEHFCYSPSRIDVHHISTWVTKEESDCSEPPLGLWKTSMKLFFEFTIRFQVSFAPERHVIWESTRSVCSIYFHSRSSPHIS